MQMIQIPPEQATPALTGLFHVENPLAIRALAVLSSGNAGKIFTDNPANPSWCLVWEADDGTLLRAGAYDREILARSVSILRQEGVVAFPYRDSDPDLELFPPDPQAGAWCLEFTRPIGASDLSPYLQSLPAGFSVQQMDRKLLLKSPACEEHMNRYGGVENFLRCGLAVCVLHGSQIVSEAYADIDVQGIREIGISTLPEYRRLGLATAACAHLIRLCELAGSAAYWDSVKVNVRSARLARKLGFANERSYRLLAWFRQEEE